jgi:hypothetical protein
MDNAKANTKLILLCLYSKLAFQEATVDKKIGGKKPMIKNQSFMEDKKLEINKLRFIFCIQFIR